KLLLLGEDVTRTHQTNRAPEGMATWKLADLGFNRDQASPAGQPQGEARFAPVPISRDDVAEIIFTSGATAQPKGVVLTHRNVLANIIPVEREVRKYRKYGRPFFPLRFLNLL